MNIASSLCSCRSTKTIPQQKQMRQKSVRFSCETDKESSDNDHRNSVEYTKAELCKTRDCDDPRYTDFPTSKLKDSNANYIDNQRSVENDVEDRANNNCTPTSTLNNVDSQPTSQTSARNSRNLHQFPVASAEDRHIVTIFREGSCSRETGKMLAKSPSIHESFNLSKLGPKPKVPPRSKLLGMKTDPSIEQIAIRSRVGSPPFADDRSTKVVRFRRSSSLSLALNLSAQSSSSKASSGCDLNRSTSYVTSKVDSVSELNRSASSYVSSKIDHATSSATPVNRASRRPECRVYDEILPTLNVNTSALLTDGCICFGATRVELLRPPNAPLGLGIAGGLDTNSQPRVSYLRPGSIAHRSDNVCVGDLLVSVNDIRVGTLKHLDILTLLRNAGERVCVELEYSLMQIRSDKPAGVRSRTTDILLEKEGGGFGFTVRGGSWGPGSENSRPLTIVVIRAGGPADREGRLRSGDRLVAINGVDVSSATLSRAQQLIRDASGQTAFTIEYDVSNADNTISRRSSSPILVEITKPLGPDFGLRFEVTTKPGTAGKKAILVEAIVPASPADRSGCIRVGDEVLSINGTCLEYTTLPEVTQLIRGSQTSQIKLEILPVLESIYTASQRHRQKHQSIRHSSVTGRKHQRGTILGPKRSESTDGFRGYSSRESSLDVAPYYSGPESARSRSRVPHSIDSGCSSTDHTQIITSYAGSKMSVNAKSLVALFTAARH